MWVSSMRVPVDSFTSINRLQNLQINKIDVFHRISVHIDAFNWFVAHIKETRQLIDKNVKQLNTHCARILYMQFDNTKRDHDHS